MWEVKTSQAIKRNNTLYLRTPKDKKIIDEFMTKLQTYHINTLLSKLSSDTIYDYIYNNGQDVILDYLYSLNTQLLIVFGDHSEYVAFMDGIHNAYKVLLKSGIYTPDLTKQIAMNDGAADYIMLLIYILRNDMISAFSGKEIANAG